MKGEKQAHDELRTEYKRSDFTGPLVRGKYHRRMLEEGSNVVLLDDDVAAAFRDSASVNEALRSLLDLAKTTKRLTKPPSARAKKAPSSQPR
jgi:hypothetical protein